MTKTSEISASTTIPTTTDTERTDIAERIREDIKRMRKLRDIIKHPASEDLCEFAEWMFAFNANSVSAEIDLAVSATVCRYPDDIICDEAVATLRDSYFDGRRDLPTCDARIAFDYVLTLIEDCGARMLRERTVFATYVDACCSELRDVSNNLDRAGFAYSHNDPRTGAELEEKAVKRLRAMLRQPDYDPEPEDMVFDEDEDTFGAETEVDDERLRVLEAARACMDVASAQRAGLPAEQARLRTIAIDLIKNLLIDTGHCDRVNVLAAWDAVYVIGAAEYDAYYNPASDHEWACLEDIYDAYDKEAQAHAQMLARETSGA